MTAADPATRAEAPPVLLAPDPAFLARLRSEGGEDLRRCYQCATCSATCDLSAEQRPFPRKEMAWAQWGLHDRLVADPDLWLCHQCGDCTSRCPRGARPGDVMAALRRETIRHHAFPAFLGRHAEDPRFLGMAALLAAALFATLAATGPHLPPVPHPERVVISYVPSLPHGVLFVTFGVLAALSALASVVGVVRFWRALPASHGEGTPAGVPPDAQPPVRGWGASLAGAARRILWHDDFGACTSSRSRQRSHLLVFLGFAGLLLVDAAVLLVRFPPFAADGLLYPFSLWSPWKILANVAGLAVLVGVALMARDRLAGPPVGVPRAVPATGRSDIVLLTLVALVVLTGFATEVVHYARWADRGLVYGAHLVPVALLFLVLPYSKLAHALYRTAALIHAERTGRFPVRGGSHVAR